MPVPTKPWTDIPDTKIDADSPWTEEVTTWMRDNAVNTDERVGVPASGAARVQNHRHRGLASDGSAPVSLGPSLHFVSPQADVTPGTLDGTFRDVAVGNYAVRPASDLQMKWWDNSASTFNDVTSSARLDDAVNTGSMMQESADYFYLGCVEPFDRVNVDVATAAAGAGVLTVEYFDGAAFTAVSGLVDGTKVGANTFAQDGKITFEIPGDWAVGADAVQSGLSSSMFFVRLKFANNPSTPPNLDQCVPRPETASVAILGVHVVSGLTQTDISFRENGDTNTGMSFTAESDAAGNSRHSFQCQVPLDDTEIFEVQKSAGGGGAASYTLYLQGYVV
jgi:hypothetical protein